MNSMQTIFLSMPNNRNATRKSDTNLNKSVLSSHLTLSKVDETAHPLFGLRESHHDGHVSHGEASQKR